MKLFFTLALISLVMSGCSNLNHEKISQDGYYYNYKNSYKFKVPDNLYKPKIYEDYLPERNFSLVIIQDDFGNLARIEDEIFTDEIMDLLTGVETANKYSEFFETIFINCIFQPISEQISSIKVLEKKYVDLDGVGPAYFAALYLPEGATLQDSETGIRCDSERAFMISLCENHLVVFSTQTVIIKELRRFNMEDNSNLKKMYERLVELRKSYRIIKDAE